jgi:predicted anti-sigma-YlaC factor YlaD
MSEDHPTRYELSLWVDGEASEDACERIRAHVMKCPLCRAEVETMRKLSRLLTSARMPDRLELGEGGLWQALAPRLGRRAAGGREEWAVPLLSALLYLAWQAASVVFIAMGIASLFGVSVPHIWILEMAGALLESFGLAWMVGLPGNLLGLVSSNSSFWMSWSVSAILWMLPMAGVTALFAGWLASRWKEACPMRKVVRRGRRPDANRSGGERWIM